MALFVGSEHDVSTRHLHVTYHLIFHWLSINRMLSPLNKPLIFRMLEVKIIQSKRWRSPLTRHAHILTRHAHARNRLRFRHAKLNRSWLISLSNVFRTWFFYNAVHWVLNHCNYLIRLLDFSRTCSTYDTM